jgi:hypothetical protein
VVGFALLGFSDGKENSRNKRKDTFVEHRSTFIYLTRPIRPGYVEEMLPEEAAAMQARKPQ